jgi:hypothetical protein
MVCLNNTNGGFGPSNHINKKGENVMKKLFAVLTMCIVMMFAGQAMAEVNQVGFSNDFSGANADATVEDVTAQIGEAGTIKDSFNGIIYDIESFNIF